MGHDAIGGRALGGVDGADPSGPDMAIGEAGEAEGFLLPILALDRDAAALRIDSYHAGGVLIQSPRASIVAGEMNPVSGALLLHDL